MIEKLYLVDRNPDLIQEWSRAFKDFPEVEVLAGDYFQVEADVIVSPANSFGFMDGGLDYAIREKLGVDIEATLQEHIVTQYHGELPVGHCIVTDTKSLKWPRLAAIPTMRVPENIQGTLNVYYAFRALLLASRNQQNGGFKSVLCPGLGTGIGGMNAKNCASQMAFAYRQFQSNARIATAREVLSIHSQLDSLR